jgi:hypothetical protein
MFFMTQILAVKMNLIFSKNLCIIVMSYEMNQKKVKGIRAK